MIGSAARHHHYYSLHWPFWSKAAKANEEAPKLFNQTYFFLRLSASITYLSVYILYIGKLYWFSSYIVFFSHQNIQHSAKNAAKRQRKNHECHRMCSSYHMKTLISKAYLHWFLWQFVPIFAVLVSILLLCKLQIIYNHVYSYVYDFGCGKDYNHQTLCIA